MKQYNVGVIGATGMVGQRFSAPPLLPPPLPRDPRWRRPGVRRERHMRRAVKGKWAFEGEAVPAAFADMVVYDAEKDIGEIAKRVDFVFCAVNMDKGATARLEEEYAKREIPVVSNIPPPLHPGRAHGHSRNQRRTSLRLPLPEKAAGDEAGIYRGEIQLFATILCPLLHPLKKFGIVRAAVCTYQAISGAGKTFATMPEIIDNVIPYIGGEEEKSEKEPLKIWGKVENGKICPADAPAITAQCFRVPVSDGHTAAVFVSFEKKPTKEEILEAWASFRGEPQELSPPLRPRAVHPLFR